jgi:hypothetical protein
MKKKTTCKILFGLSLIGLFAVSENGSAAEYKPPVKTSNLSSDSLVEGFDDSDNIVVLSDGTILHGGKFELGSSVAPIAPINIDTETSPSSITVNEYKKLKEKGETIPTVAPPATLVRGSKPAKTVVTISDQGSVTSKPFSGSGWRFAGYIYKPSKGTGDYLQWQALGDSGNVGTESDAKETYRVGTAFGTALYDDGYGQYFTGPGGKTTFYTYNPANGSKYRVQNK